VKDQNFEEQAASKDVRRFRGLSKPQTIRRTDPLRLLDPRSDRQALSVIPFILLIEPAGNSGILHDFRVRMLTYSFQKSATQKYSELYSISGIELDIKK
jgi:hypothetical protein